ncbi:MAG: TetR/AcrR family transcriptional regulator [Spirochaetaceae bacterium]|jgi:AcrR family transcriptional regulator|nr:TetR/AcrR family transcriptional regulator [Spirochaetaceae bacterium]
MTQDDIIRAAFTVWGEDLYRTTDLSKLAKALGVTKAALYRHFPGKTSLLKAMESRFLKDYTAWFKPRIEEIRRLETWQDRLFLASRALTGYFARHFDYLVYCLVRLHGNKKRYTLDMETVERQEPFFTEFVSMFPPDQSYPSVLVMVSITSIFEAALFCKRRYAGSFSPPAEEEILSLVESTGEKIRRGLGFDREIVDSLLYDRLEALGGPDRRRFAPGDPLLAAAAKAIAEAGIWKVSMETVAKCSGLSKSGLYFHFKSKEDMFAQLIMTEFERIAAIVTARSSLSAKQEERLYLTLLSIVDYLNLRPEILILLDWLRIRRLKIKLFVPEVLNGIFAGLNFKTPASESLQENAAQWVLFLLVALLMRCLRRQPAAETEEAPAAGMDDRSVRKLYRFITLGVEGWQGPVPGF